MHKLYEKSELLFFFAWLLVYIIGSSILDNISVFIGIEKLFTSIFHIMLSAISLIWMNKRRLLKKYGIVKPNVPAVKLLFYIPLVVLVSCNLWFGIKSDIPIGETILYVVSMIGVGFVEEFIFRGLLFKAMEKNGIKSAIAVSSVTFGIGHVINLINGSGADVVSTLCQVFSAIAFGFLFTIIFYRSQSLLPCIFAHITINSLSVFAKEISAQINIFLSAVLIAVAVLYAFFILHSLPKNCSSESDS